MKKERGGGNCRGATLLHKSQFEKLKTKKNGHGKGQEGGRSPFDSSSDRLFLLFFCLFYVFETARTGNIRETPAIIQLCFVIFLFVLSSSSRDTPAPIM